ncbi:MAG TPA: hypothetical protein VGS19_23800 [Streptosporangiaceae bacterium]|nr:hypothetical protein [Streptosporangiaceae bacterium]
MKTLADVTAAHGFEVLEHLEADAEVPVLDGLQAQGDLFIVPTPVRGFSGGEGRPVPAEGIAVIEALAGGHEHRLFAGEPGKALWEPDSSRGQVIGYLETTAPAYVLHPEHGATGIAPGAYELRRQREQADEERLVAD